MEEAKEMDKAVEGMARLVVAEEVEEVEVLTKGGMLKISGALKTEEKMKMVACIEENIDVFTWIAVEIDIEVACHRLNLDPDVRPIRQKKSVITTALLNPSGRR